ncbi:amidase signature domain-containing protein [Aspergillus keveii]|uniref:Amidase signature domain-containing protein n=1 Tax=Aspergillus keveii TaxID=714993 RepID=A0ABR4FKE0_9EURO
MNPHEGDTPAWQIKASKKRRECNDRIPKEWLIPQTLWETLPLPLEENKVNLMELDVIRRTNKYTVASLFAKPSTGEFIALEVATAYCKRAAVAGQLTLFPSTIARAKELDTMRESGQLKGPLHGLPISVKDCLHVAGTQATIGFTAYLDQLPSDENSCLIDMLLDLGAVRYVKTNVPQTMMTADSENIIFGRALNPWNTTLTAGRSSGGEGALIALRRSPLGIGTDVAGSIRIPALCCGLYGFKPSACRIPNSRQQEYGTGGLRTIYGSVGPLANDIDALEILTRAVLRANSRPAVYDLGVLDTPWREIGPTKPRLRFGFLLVDPTFPLHPPVRAALEEAAFRLGEAGHEIVPLPAEECHIPYSLEVVWKVVAQGGEPPIASRAVIERLAKELGLRFVPGFEDRTPLERLSTLNVKPGEIIKNWHTLWRKYDLDAVICPPAPNTAVERDMYGLTPYTSFLNLLDYPACVIPFRRAGKFPMPRGKKGNNGRLLEGAPCSVQVFTSRVRAEECLAISKVVDRCLHGDVTT